MPPPRERNRDVVKFEFSDDAWERIVAAFGDSTIKNRLTQIERKLDKVLAKTEKLMIDTIALLNKVTELETKWDSFKAIIDAVLLELKLTPEQQAAADAALAKLDALDDKVEAAIDANTPPVEPPTE